jgi:hypothetical protein
MPIANTGAFSLPFDQTSSVLLPSLIGPGSVGDAAQAKADDSAQNSGLAFNPSDSLWGIYLTLAKQKDEEMSENWSGDTEGILVFVREDAS